MPRGDAEMPIFFLNVRSGGELVRDTEGQEFSSVYAAQDEAVHAAREMAAEKVRHGLTVDGQTIEVVDETGATVAIVPVKAQIYL